MRDRIYTIGLIAIAVGGCSSRENVVREMQKALGKCQTSAYAHAKASDDFDSDAYIEACMLSDGYVFDGGNPKLGQCSPALGSPPANSFGLYRFNSEDERCYSPSAQHDRDFGFK